MLSSEFTVLIKRLSTKLLSLGSSNVEETSLAIIALKVLSSVMLSSNSTPKASLSTGFLSILKIISPITCLNGLVILLVELEEKLQDQSIQLGNSVFCSSVSLNPISILFAQT